ncbi:aminotransferase family protein [Nocardia sp. Marseille-Q1738]
MRGSGYRVWDDTGREYLDATSSSLNATCGYGREEITAAVAGQLADLHHFDLSVGAHRPAGALADRLSELLAEPLAHTLFVNSGSEAVEAAVFIAASYHHLVGAPRNRIVTFARGYHGSTVLARSLSGLPSTDPPLREPLPITRIEFPCAAGRMRHAEALEPLLTVLEKALAPDHPDGPAMALLIEPLLNVGGGVVLPDGFLGAARTLCDRYGALLILDEVFTGFGRTGRMMACDHERTVPDILLTSKGLTSGYVPLGAVTVDRRIYDTFASDPMLGGLRHGHTTSGHAAACAAALATLDILEKESLPDQAARRGRDLLRGLGQLSGHGRIVDVRGKGLVTTLELDTTQSAATLVARARSAGVLLRQQGPVVMVVPPLIIDDAGVAEIVARVLEQSADGLEGAQE